MQIEHRSAKLNLFRQLRRDAALFIQNTKQISIIGRYRTLNPQPSTLNSQLSTLNPQLSTLNPQPSTLNPQPSILNSQPITHLHKKRRCVFSTHLLQIYSIRLFNAARSLASSRIRLSHKPWRYKRRWPLPTH